MKRTFLSIIALSTLIVSCTKEVDLKLKSATPQLVIDGAITNEAGPYTVKLSKTVSFSANNLYPAVIGATAIITDNTGVIDTLKEVAAGQYRTSKLVGTPGRTYTLKVIVEGKTYNAASTMPQPVILEGLDFDIFTNKGNTGGKEYLTLPIFTDPANAVNSYRFIQHVNGKLDKTYFTLNDNTFNGLKNTQLLFNPDMEIKAGDSVAVEFRCTDKAAYDYFYTLSQINDGPYSATPSNPPNNITGAVAYGLFSAHTVQRISAVVKEK